MSVDMVSSLSNSDKGIPVPAARSISRVEMDGVRWVIVVEKDVGLSFDPDNPRY